MKVSESKLPGMRRTVLRSALVGLYASALVAAGVISHGAQAQPKGGPVTINIVDVAGDLALTQDAIELYPEKASGAHLEDQFHQGAGARAARQAEGDAGRRTQRHRPGAHRHRLSRRRHRAGRADEDSARHTPPSFPNLTANYQPAAAKMQELAQDYGVAVVFMPAGPLIEYNPDKVKQVPTTPAELLAWCKANPNRLIYARPANSGPGRTFIMGLPYILGDKNPKDPVKGWDKTWAYLKELNSCIEYYPTGTGAVMKELGEGSRDMTLTMTGWDINPRVLGIVPKSYKVAPFKGMTWVNDAHYMTIPKGVPPEKVAVVLELMAFLLTPEAQAYTYDKGYFYPGPAVKNVPLSMAPKESQDAIKEFGRPEYDKWLTEFPHTQSLPPSGAGRGVQDLGSAGRSLEDQVTLLSRSGPRERPTSGAAPQRPLKEER